MKKTNNKYLLYGLIGLVAVGAVLVLSQSSGQLYQGALITTTSTSPTTTSYTTTDTTAATLARIESKVDALTTELKIVKSNTYYTGTTMGQYANHLGYMLTNLNSASILQNSLAAIVNLTTQLPTYIKK